MNFTYGISSGVENMNFNGTVHINSSSMGNIISHTDNLKDDLVKKINEKISLTKYSASKG